jgi:hypothetical protein
MHYEMDAVMTAQMRNRLAAPIWMCPVCDRLFPAPSALAHAEEHGYREPAPACTHPPAYLRDGDCIRCGAMRDEIASGQR